MQSSCPLLLMHDRSVTSSVAAYTPGTPGGMVALATGADV